MAFSTSLIQEITDEGGAFTFTSPASQNVLGTYVQIVASTAHIVRNIIIIGSTAGISKNYRLAIATGAGGAEVVKYDIYITENVTATTISEFISFDPSVIPKGVRVAIAIANTQDAVSISGVFGVTLQEDNS